MKRSGGRETAKVEVTHLLGERERERKREKEGEGGEGEGGEGEGEITDFPVSVYASFRLPLTCS